jgi:hypothetical protein
MLKTNIEKIVLLMKQLLIVKNFFEMVNISIFLNVKKNKEDNHRIISIKQLMIKIYNLIKELNYI